MRNNFGAKFGIVPDRGLLAKLDRTATELKRSERHELHSFLTDLRASLPLDGSPRKKRDVMSDVGWRERNMSDSGGQRDSDARRKMFAELTEMKVVDQLLQRDARPADVKLCIESVVWPDQDHGGEDVSPGWAWFVCDDLNSNNNSNDVDDSSDDNEDDTGRTNNIGSRFGIVPDPVLLRKLNAFERICQRQGDDDADMLLDFVRKLREVMPLDGSPRLRCAIGLDIADDFRGKEQRRTLFRTLAAEHIIDQRVVGAGARGAEEIARTVKWREEDRGALRSDALPSLMWFVVTAEDRVKFGQQDKPPSRNHIVVESVNDDDSSATAAALPLIVNNEGAKYGIVPEPAVVQRLNRMVRTGYRQYRPILVPLLQLLPLDGSARNLREVLRELRARTPESISFDELHECIDKLTQSCVLVQRPAKYLVASRWPSQFSSSKLVAGGVCVAFTNPRSSRKVKQEEVDNKKSGDMGNAKSPARVVAAAAAASHDSATATSSNTNINTDTNTTNNTNLSDVVIHNSNNNASTAARSMSTATTTTMMITPAAQVPSATGSDNRRRDRSPIPQEPSVGLVVVVPSLLQPSPISVPPPCLVRNGVLIPRGMHRLHSSVLYPPPVLFNDEF